MSRLTAVKAAVNTANIPPSMPHSIRPDDTARFYVAFYTREGIEGIDIKKHLVF